MTFDTFIANPTPRKIGKSQELKKFNNKYHPENGRKVRKIKNIIPKIIETSEILKNWL